MAEDCKEHIEKPGGPTGWETLCGKRSHALMADGENPYPDDCKSCHRIYQANKEPTA
jgi:hypothetical protein